MYKLFFAILLSVATSFYSLSFTDSNSESISMQTFKGKKVLLVNVASNSRLVSQLAQLQQLQELYKDQLVVIGFPSNSFNHEPLADNAIRDFCRNAYGVTFLLAQKVSVKEIGIHPLYNWLTRQSENGVMEGPVSGDFHKYLIDEQGNLVGAWAPTVNPLDQSLKDAIVN